MMRYFKEELLEATLNFLKTDEERQLADEQWQQACDKYAQEMRKLQDKLPKRFYHMLENGFFHDASIDCISFIKNRSKKRRITYDVVLSITYKGKRSEIIHRDIFDFKTNIDFSEGYIDFGDYINGEIIFENGIWIHNFTCFNYNEINIKCKKIEWKPEKKDERGQRIYPLS